MPDSKKYISLDALQIFLNSLNTSFEEKYIEIDESIKSKLDSSTIENYYTKTETDELELITVDDIDIICGGAISYAEDVMF